MTRRTWGIVVGGLASAVVAIWLLARSEATVVGDDGSDTYQPTLSAGPPGSQAVDSVGAALVERWLEHYTTPDAGADRRLQAYRIDRIHVTEHGGDTIVSATLSVRPTRRSFDNWLAGSGGTVDGEWIRGKFTRFLLTERGGGFYLREIGPGPL